LTKKVHILKDNSDETLYTLGVVSSDSILQLSMSLNNYFNLGFKLTSPIKSTKTAEISFSCSLHEEEEVKCFLIKNKHSGHVLFTSFPQIDFILALTGDKASELNNQLSESLRLLENISVVTALDNKKLRKLKSLLLTV
jgi:hypothetical protein